MQFTYRCFVLSGVLPIRVPELVRSKCPGLLLMEAIIKSWPLLVGGAGFLTGAIATWKAIVDIRLNTERRKAVEKELMIARKKQELLELQIRQISEQLRKDQRQIVVATMSEMRHEIEMLRSEMIGDGESHFYDANVARSEPLVAPRKFERSTVIYWLLVAAVLVSAVLRVFFR